jgi:hypothetical protein
MKLPPQSTQLRVLSWNSMEELLLNVEDDCLRVIWIELPQPLRGRGAAE